MEISVVAVGKLRPYYREAVDDYARRLKRYARFSEHEVREASRAPTMPAQLAEEAGRLSSRIPQGANLVALTRDGAGWSSAYLARQLEQWLAASRPLAFALGGSHGLDSSLLTRASARWSLGPLTLPHELARVVVVEQLYRAFTILRGEPYHKGARSGSQPPAPSS
ncbi:MAG TPA: 23S rRNA (pseudouridine(1915)-N(3))-methyltransferase RlmH [Gemmatimonadales bacterium]|jgi:23S rRNA (pseudouridine1915-N3)-methyltransferase|nr:23S rRNA (pseudouridine(1915)-N(3))-methyltransferase RlmH [Gemmatimonadales bacterium]